MITIGLSAEEKEAIKSKIKYDKETGEFYRIMKSGTRAFVPSGAIPRIKVNNRPYDAKKIAWFLATDEYPKTPVYQINGDSNDYRFINLVKGALDKREPLTADRARILFRYDEATGSLYRNFPAGGQPAGKVEMNISKSGYLRVMVDRKRIQAHRLIWLIKTGKFPFGVIDHKNRNKTDNRWSNLRDVSEKENGMNKHSTINMDMKIQSKNGIWQDTESGLWIAQIDVGSRREQKPIYLGEYNTYDDALSAYAKAQTIFKQEVKSNG